MSEIGRIANLKKYLFDNAEALCKLIEEAESRSNLLRKLDGEVSIREYEAINDEICRHEILIEQALGEIKT